MALIILQPCGDNDARDHYLDTVLNSIPIAKITHLIDSKTAKDLCEIYSAGSVKVWGVTPGKGKSTNISKWNRISVGDVTLFARQNHVFATGVTTYKNHNRELAEFLWGTKEDGQTWEYIYFVSEVQELNIPYKELNKVIGYKENYVIQGFNVLDDDKSEKVLSAFNLESGTYFPEYSAEEVVSELQNLDSLESASNSSTRKEQAYLRNILFSQREIFKCCICGRTYPSAFLVAAHIKKRAICTLDEKKDFSNIVAPMCKFGCDDLYEKGYIAVSEGKVKIIKQGNTHDILTHLRFIEGKECSAWRLSTKKYFAWHLDRHMRREI